MFDFPLGADVSFYQRKVDMRGAMQDGVEFIGIRWGQRDGRGGYTDFRARENWEAAKEAGVLRLMYWVWDQRAGHTASAHMGGIRRFSRTYDGELPPWADLELLPLDWDEFHDWLIMLESWASVKPDIYTGSWAMEKYAPLPLWLKDYNFCLTGYNDIGPSVYGPLKDLNPNVVCWQQTSSWFVNWVNT
ncbi:hypothetical protein LCGC14_2154680 [marine sediment metagenome]|uniref:Glycoside hydrolase family 42 N-terminal domain-containing protein n=1 Tax=marine sediment metagenome TaxID=412755 RepID=A0A0F9DUF5_9ZZZZ